MYCPQSGKACQLTGCSEFYRACQPNQPLTSIEHLSHVEEIVIPEEIMKWIEAEKQYLKDNEYMIPFKSGAMAMYRYLQPLAKVISYLNEIGREAARERQTKIELLEKENASLLLKVKELQDWHDSHK